MVSKGTFSLLVKFIGGFNAKLEELHQSLALTPFLLWVFGKNSQTSTFMAAIPNAGESLKNMKVKEAWARSYKKDVILRRVGKQRSKDLCSGGAKCEVEPQPFAPCQLDSSRVSDETLLWMTWDGDRCPSPVPVFGRKTEHRKSWQPSFVPKILKSYFS